MEFGREFQRFLLEERLDFGNGLMVPRIMAAPLDGVIDLPMRRMIRRFSPSELLFTEMTHVSYVANEKTGKALRSFAEEEPICFQISGSGARFTYDAVRRIVDAGFNAININAGCPARRVVNSGCGSALMANSESFKKILHEAVRAAGKVPVTVKMRSGFKTKTAREVAKIAVDLGATAIIIHPRLQTGGFSAPLDFELVKELKETLAVPIIFSGNIFNSRLLKMTYEKTGVDGFMIGRALWGAPWKMKEIAAEIRGEKFEISLEEKISLALEHLDLMVEEYGPHGVHAFKKHVSAYLKGFRNAAETRVEMLRSQTPEEMREKLQALRRYLS